MLVAENKSEEKDIKTIVLCRKMDFPSLFRGKIINFVRVLLLMRYMETFVKIAELLEVDINELLGIEKRKNSH